METTQDLMKYLQIPAREKAETELYGHLPLDLESLHEQFTKAQDALYHFDKKTNSHGIKDAVYLAEGEETTIELHSPSVLLRVETHFSPEVLKDFCRQYAGSYQFVPLGKLLSEQASLADPGEDLIISMPTTPLSVLLADHLLLKVCREFASTVERQMAAKIIQTSERLTQLKNLSVENAVKLDYLDVRHSSLNFISFDEQNSGHETFHYFNRSLGVINNRFTVGRSKGILTLTRQQLTSEAKETLQQKLERGNEIYYLRNWEKVLLTEYLHATQSKD